MVFDTGGNMTNQQKMEAWTGGDWKGIPVFSDYSYEGCLLGVSTDGRAVYDFDLVMDFLFNQCKDEYDVNDFEDADDMEYNIKLSAAAMINDDLAAYSSEEKLPVFFETGDVELQGNAYKFIESEYDFSKCIIGSDRHEYRGLYSLSKMIEVIKEKKNCTDLEAKKIVYSFDKAGTVTEDAVYYIIVDDRFDLGSIN